MLWRMKQSYAERDCYPEEFFVAALTKGISRGALSYCKQDTLGQQSM
jgi:hypothetical protein